MGYICQQTDSIASLQTDVKNLNGWQKQQNGSILRVEEKLDKLIFWFMTFAASTIMGFVINILVLLLNK